MFLTFVYYKTLSQTSPDLQNHMGRKLNQKASSKHVTCGRFPITLNSFTGLFTDTMCSLEKDVLSF